MNQAAKISEQPYTKEFYDFKKGWTHISAEAVINDLLTIITPKSVVDVGCGTGTWLASFSKKGVDDILGIDGDYVEQDMLEIPDHNFRPYDLTKPLEIERTFDLAISLEVAEHLPEIHAPEFVKSLTQCAPVILFSAAIPHQGGVNHINEQWQDYWCNIFLDEDFIPVDLIRKKVWQNEEIAEHYRQNIMLYVKKSYAEQNPLINQAAKDTILPLINIVHPKRYLKLIERIENLKKQNKRTKQEMKNIQNPQYMSLARHLSLLPILIKNAFLNKLKKVSK